MGTRFAGHTPAPKRFHDVTPSPAISRNCTAREPITISACVLIAVAVSRGTARDVVLVVGIEGDDTGKALLKRPGKCRLQRPPFAAVLAVADEVYRESFQNPCGSVIRAVIDDQDGKSLFCSASRATSNRFHGVVRRYGYAGFHDRPTAAAFQN